jgi:hypothetical protein
MTRAPLAFVLVALWSSSARAEDELAVTGQVEWISAARGLLPTEADTNPGNQVLRLPHARLSSELRPSVQVQWGDWLTVVARPHLIGALDKAQVQGEWAEHDAEVEASLTELFGTWVVSDALALSWGLQNFQWGPGELASPSNRLFHETGFMRDPLFRIRGRHLVRVNASVGKALSAVVLVELTENGAPDFVARHDFAPSAHAKLEYADESGRFFVGATASSTLEGEAAVGAYGQAQLIDELALYVDASALHAREAWYPQGDRFELRERSHDLPLTGSFGAPLGVAALVGARASFDSGAEARVELFYNQAGWSEDDFEQAQQVVTRSGDVAAWLAPGFELIGQRFVYLSLRVPDLPPMKRVTLQPRALYSATDGSAMAFVTVSTEVGDSATAFLSALATIGDPHDELSRIVRAAVTFGVLQVW